MLGLPWNVSERRIDDERAEEGVGVGAGAGGRSGRSDRSSGWHSKSEEQSKTVTTPSRTGSYLTNFSVT